MVQGHSISSHVCPTCNNAKEVCRFVPQSRFTKLVLCINFCWALLKTSLFRGLLETSLFRGLLETSWINILDLTAPASIEGWCKDLFFSFFSWAVILLLQREWEELLPKLLPSATWTRELCGIVWEWQLRISPLWRTLHEQENCVELFGNGNSESHHCGELYMNKRIVWDCLGMATQNPITVENLQQRLLQQRFTHNLCCRSGPFYDLFFGPELL